MIVLSQCKGKIMLVSFNPAVSNRSCSMNFGMNAEELANNASNISRFVRDVRRGAIPKTTETEEIIKASITIAEGLHGKSSAIVNNLLRPMLTKWPNI